MASMESLIAGSEKLTRIYGGWPSFHDAEVIELHHWRGQMKPGDWDESNVMPVLTTKIHILVQSPTSHHTLATLRFEDVDDFRMEGFNHQNAIFELSIQVEDRGTDLIGRPLTPYFVVRFEPAFGISALFRCFRIEVVDAVRCTEEGKVYT